MNVASGGHVLCNVVLQLWHRLQGVRLVLVALDLTDDLGRLGPLCEVDGVLALDLRGDAIFDEDEIGEVDACVKRRRLYQHRSDTQCEPTNKFIDSKSKVRGQESTLPINGTHGGLDSRSASRYLRNFLVLSIRSRIPSSKVMIRLLTASQVLFRREIGAVPNAHMIENSVE